MKRDMTLVREILLATEAHPPGQGPANLQLPGFSAEQMSYHVKIMAEAGFIEALDASTHDGMEWNPTSLTWQGHEFLDAVRNETVWRKTLTFIKEKGGSVPFEIVKTVAVKLAASAVGID
jgi:Hypothetical protein (DUF2513)